MSGPNLKVIGVYRPAISEQTWQEQWQVTEEDKTTREHFDKLVLIEAVVERLSGPFDFSKFGQMDHDHPDDSRYVQVGYDEGLLSADGESLIQRRMHCVQGVSALRGVSAFVRSRRPLQWEGGQVTCPPMEEAPLRLMMLMPYNACS